MWPNIDPNHEIPNIPPSLSLSLSLSHCVQGFSKTNPIDHFYKINHTQKHNNGVKNPSLRRLRISKQKMHSFNKFNDAESIRKVASEGFVYPFDLPSLSFYLPEGTLSLSLSLYIYVCVCENHLFGCWENEVRR